MKFRVIITPQAEDDLQTAYCYIRKHAPEAARTWIKGIRRKIKTLARYPERARSHGNPRRFTNRFENCSTAAGTVEPTAFSSS